MILDTRSMSVILLIFSGLLAGYVFLLSANSSTTQNKQYDDNEETSDITDPSQQAELHLQTVDTPDPVTVGENLTYTIAVTNTGAESAHNVVLTDPLPTNTTFRSVQVTTGSGTCTELAVGAKTGTITCNLGTINPGVAETIQIVVRPTAAASQAGFVRNIVTTDGSNTTPASDTEFTQVDPSGVTVTKDDKRNPVKVGKAQRYTLTVANNTDATQDLILRDKLPSRVDFTAVNPNNICEETSKIVTCEIDNLASGESTTVLIDVVPKRRGTITNSAQLFFQGDRFTPIDQSTESTRVVRRH
jgi:uncharacterized repeat protein (TIGR01451 family)